MLGLFRWATAAALVGLLLPSALEAQYPRARRGQFEVSGLDFRPDGAWRSRVAAIRSSRRRWLRQGALAALNLPSSASSGKVTGRVIVPVVPIAFRNVPPPFTRGRYQDVIYDPAPLNRSYSLKSYYEQLSNGNVTIDGRVFDWFIADSADWYYEDGCNGIGVLAPCPQRTVSRFGELLLRALDGVSESAPATVWSDYDNDGPDGLPNSGDDDGVVDFVTFLQADQDGACPNSPHIWAHRFVIRAWNGGSPYVTRTPWIGHPGEFLKIDSYTIQSAVGGNTACDPTSVMPIGTLAHETGHAFGLPDLYDTDLRSAQVTQGVGEWSLMGSGNYARPYSPARYDAWSLFELGWVSVDSLSSGREVRLGSVAGSDTVMYVPVPGTDEFYLLENRQPEQSDTAQMNPAFGNRQKSPGLLVWHIDEGQIEEHGLGRDNRVNSGAVHGVALVQADGRSDLEQPSGSNRGDVGDAFPGSTGNTEICRATTPALRDNQGGFAWFCLDRISQTSPSGPISFRYISYHSVFGVDHPEARIRVNGSVLERLDRFFAPGTPIEISVDSLQADSTGRTRFEFLAWSDAGSRSHTLIAGDTPDTVLAHVALQYRLRTVVQGAGAAAVVSTLSRDINSGVFLNQGSRITLAAAPQAGAVFSRWTGDTSSSRDSLTLTMAHPFDLVANFVPVRSIAMQSAADALLGRSRLALEDVAYLDAAGNRDGVYDLGDFLAAMHRSEFVDQRQLTRTDAR